MTTSGAREGAASGDERACCPVCLGASAVAATVRGRPLLRCAVCGLHFYAVGEDLPADLYAEAYEGTVSEAHMDQFSFRARHLFDPATDFAAAPALTLSLRWLREHADPGCRVLDIGCGRGTMLRLLRAAGFRADGLDLSPTVALILAQQGFDVHVGPVATYPDTRPTPNYVTCNFVLHHPRDPIAFLVDLRRRFPRSPLLLTERLSFSNWLEQTAFMPRNWPEYPRDLTAWNPRALSTALIKAGYIQHEFSFTPPSAHDTMLPLQNRLTSLLGRRRGREKRSGAAPHGPSGRRVVLALRAMRLVREALYGAQASWARIRRLAPASVLVVAYPDAN